MSPNFWGCRCCGPRYCVIRCLDHDGNEIWTWKDHNLWRGGPGVRADGFAVNAAGYVAHCGGDVETGSIGLINPSGVTVWDSPAGFETTEFVYPAIDDLNNVYAISIVSTTLTLHCFDDEGNEVWSEDFTTSTTIFGVVSNGTEVFLCYKKSTSGGYSTWTVVCLDSDGNILGTADYGPATLKLSWIGIIGVDASGNVLVPFYNYPGGGIDGGVDILDTSCSVVSSLPIQMNVTSGIAESGSIFGIAELSDGRITLAGFERVTGLVSRSVLWDCTNDSLLFLPDYETGTTANYQPANTVFGDGSIFFMERANSTSVTRLLNRSDEAGAVQFRITDTDRSPEIPAGAVYNGFQVACNADRVYIGSASSRPKNGWTIT